MITKTTPRPEWAARVLASLMEAGISGHTPTGAAELRLTRGEQLLLDGVAFRLRARLGEQGTHGDLGETGDALLRIGMEQIAPVPEPKPAGGRGGWVLVAVSAVAAVVFGVMAVAATVDQRATEAGLYGFLTGGYLVLAITVPPSPWARREPKDSAEEGGTQ